MYLDINSNLGINAKPELLSGMDDINNSIQNILQCPVGTRPWQRDYGSRLYEMLQEPVDAITATSIEMGVVQAIQRWEPRIKLDSANTRVSALSDNTGYNVEIAYTIIQSGIVGSLSMSARA